MVVYAYNKKCDKNHSSSAIRYDRKSMLCPGMATTLYLFQLSLNTFRSVSARTATRKWAAHTDHVNENDIPRIPRENQAWNYVRRMTKTKEMIFSFAVLDVNSLRCAPRPGMCYRRYAKNELSCQGRNACGTAIGSLCHCLGRRHEWKTPAICWVAFKYMVPFDRWIGTIVMLSAWAILSVFSFSIGNYFRRTRVASLGGSLICTN